MATKSVVPLLVTGMLITGCANSLLTKWQDNMCVANCEPGSKLPPAYFEQPVWQTLNMFAGEMLCFLPVIFAKLAKARRPRPMLVEEDEASVNEGGKVGIPMRGWSICWFWLPALCDLTATTLMGAGLLHIPVSIYQMTRGALVLWVGILSVVLLRTRLLPFQWFSLITVMFGVGLVGLSGSLVNSPEPSEIDATMVMGSAADPELILGMFLVLFAQLFAATQYVLEDKIMKTYSVEAMLAVGYEGFFGTFSLLLCLPILHFIPSIPLRVIPPASELTHDVLLASTLIMFSIASFNYFGLSVTRKVSATARSTIDTCRTLGIWMGSVALGWERVVWPGSVPQIVGFGVLVYGTFLFNGLVKPPSFMRPTEATPVPLVDPATTDSDPLSGLSVPEGERRPLLANQQSA